MSSFWKMLPAALMASGAMIIGTTIAPAASAQENEHKSESAKPGMETWKWANFAILAGVLGWLISKNLGPVLVARSRQIEEGLAAGERAKANAEARASAVTAKLSGLEQAITVMRSSAHIEREREGTRIKSETAMDLTRLQQNAAFEIESATKLARLAVRRYAAKLAVELAEQKVRARMSGDVQAALVQNFLGDIGSASSTAGKLS